MKRSIADIDEETYSANGGRNYVKKEDRLRQSIETQIEKVLKTPLDDETIKMMFENFSLITILEEVKTKSKLLKETNFNEEKAFITTCNATNVESIEFTLIKVIEQCMRDEKTLFRMKMFLNKSLKVLDMYLDEIKYNKLDILKKQIVNLIADTP